MKRSVSRLLSSAAMLGLAGVTLGGIGLAGARVTAAQGQLPFSEGSRYPTRVADPPTDGTRVVAVVLGSSSTVATDAMGPFEVFGRSARFSVYTVAEDAAPARVDGAPAILPDHTFAEVDDRPELAPDVVVVPAVADPAGKAERPLREWVVRQHARGAHVLGVCAGARVLAATGLLDGRTATSHWSQLRRLRDEHPGTTWLAGRRFVRDGTITTTGGITSGIPGALAVLEELTGTAEARRVGAQVGYPGWSPDGSTEIPVQSLGLDDRPVVLNTLLPWLRPTVAIELEDGLGEIDVASVFETFYVSAAARTLAVSRTGVVRTAHGLTLLTLTERDVPDVGSTLRPGVIGPSGRSGFDGALEHLAETAGAATARSAAKMVDYPTDDLQLGSAAGSRRTAMLGVVGLTLAALVGMAPLVLRRHQRRRVPSDVERCAT